MPHPSPRLPATIWYGHHNQRQRRIRYSPSDGSELFAATIWGDLPLWDGRSCTEFPWEDGCETRLSGYDTGKDHRP